MILEASSLTTITSAIIVAVISTVLFRLFFSGGDTLKDVPVAGSGSEEKRRQEYLINAKNLYADSYNKFKGGLFRMTMSDGSKPLVPTGKFIDELGKLPDNVLSQAAMGQKFLEVKYTKIVVGDDLLKNAVKTDLTSGLARLTPALSDEVDASCALYMPPCDDWTAVKPYETLSNIVARVSGLILIGRELYDNEEYLDMALHYTMDAFGGVRAIKGWHRFLQPIVAPFLPEIRRCNEQTERMRKWLSPVVKARLEAQAANKPGYQKPDDMLQWMLEKTKKFGVRGETYMARMQLSLAMAAIHTTGMTATHFFYDLAARPEYMHDLRAEINSVMAESGGVFTHATLQKLTKLDSFLKESFRFNPPFIENMQRLVMKDFDFSDGTHVPANTHCLLPAHAMNMDPNLYPDPEKFDGARFEKLRQQHPENAKKYNFTSINPTMVNFGFGRNACPGRYFAENEIKLIVAYFLLHYDMKMPPGETERYKNLEIGLSILPDGDKTLLFKRVC